jgi:hypothetical protein
MAAHALEAQPRGFKLEERRIDIEICGETPKFGVKLTQVWGRQRQREFHDSTIARNPRRA